MNAVTTEHRFGVLDVGFLCVVIHSFIYLFLFTCFFIFIYLFVISFYLIFYYFFLEGGRS